MYLKILERLILCMSITAFCTSCSKENTENDEANQNQKNTEIAQDLFNMINQRRLEEGFIEELVYNEYLEQKAFEFSEFRHSIEPLPAGERNQKVAEFIDNTQNEIINHIGASPTFGPRVEGLRYDSLYVTAQTVMSNIGLSTADKPHSPIGRYLIDRRYSEVGIALSTKNNTTFYSFVIVSYDE